MDVVKTALSDVILQARPRLAGPAVDQLEAHSSGLAHVHAPLLGQELHGDRRPFDLEGGVRPGRDLEAVQDRRGIEQEGDLAIGAERKLGGSDWLEGYGVSLGGRLGYSHYIDRLYPSASGPGFRLLLTLRISAL